MTENIVSESQKLEMQYQELLKKKNSFMAQEVLAYEEAAKAKELEMNNKAEQDRRETEYLVYKERMVKELGLDKKPALDPMSNSQMATIGSTKNAKFMAFRESFLKKHGYNKSNSYGSMAFQDEMTALTGYAFTDSDSGCADVLTAWNPADYYCDMIWHGKRTYGYLSGKVTVQGCDLRNGNGGIAQIRVLSARKSQTTLSLSQGCTCITCVSNSFTTYTATTDIIGDYAVLCDIDVFTAGDVLKPAVIESMSRNIAGAIDYQIYNELYGATPGYTVRTDHSFASVGPTGSLTGSCCTIGNIFNAIIRAEAQMRGANYFDTRDPILIIHPTWAAFLKYKEGVDAPVWMTNQITMDGNKIAKIGSIQVIEYPGAAAYSAVTTGAIIGILIDPERAVSEIYGKRPYFKMDDDPIECLSTKLVAATYVAIDELDTSAICHIATMVGA